MKDVNDSIDVLVFVRHKVGFTFAPNLSSNHIHEIVYFELDKSLVLMTMSAYQLIRSLILNGSFDYITEIQLIKPKMNSKQNFHTAYNGYYQ